MSNLLYIKERVIQGLLETKEYKSNFYIGLLSHLTFTSVLTFSTYIVLNFSSSINLSLLEIIFLMLYAQVMAMFFGLFRWGNKLNQELVTGKINVYLMKPKNTFFQYLLNSIPYFSIPLPIIDFLLLMVFSLSFSLFDFSKLLSTFIISIPGGIMYVLFFRFFDSMAFFMKNNKFLVKNYYVIERGYYQFPLIIFDGFLNKLGLVVGHSVFGILPVLYYFDKIDNNIILEMYIVIFPVIILLLIGIIINWKIGLKKYEAYE